MQVSVESTGDIERKLIVEVPAERVDQEVEKRLKDMRGKVRLDGFRPGKVPVSVIKEKYGPAVHQEVVGDVIQQTLYEAATQEDLRLAGAPSSVTPDTMTIGEPLKYTATVEVYPEIEIGALDTIEITRQSTDITDADIDKMIEVLRNQQKEWKETDAAAADGNQVVLSFDGSIDGEPFDGGKAEDFSMEVGRGQMIPDFEKAVIGMKAGDEKDADVSFPDDYQAENLKGKTVQFNLKVSSVNESVLPEVDDEFYKKFGVDNGSEDDFRAEVKKNMERELAQTLKARVKQSVMDGLSATHEVAAPSSLVSEEIKQMRTEMSQNGGYDATKLPEEMFKSQAERRVKLGLIVGEIIKQNNLEKDQDRIDAMLDELSASYEDPSSVIEYYKSNPQAMQTVEAAVLEEMIVDWVLDQAKVTDEITDFDSIMNPDKAEQEAA
ncbi:MAG TPA: trigger factor [Thiothrix sp.]|nr:trigger factor [Thiothrix sp.]